MKYLSYGERAFLRGHLNRVRHVTLDPDGPGVVRIHLIPCTKPDRDTPFVAILNGQDILPLNLSWAILLTNLIEALQPHSGTELKDSDWSAINAQAVAADENATQDEVDAAADTLQAALNGLVFVDGTTGTANGGNGATTPVGDGSTPTKTGDAGVAGLAALAALSAGALIVLKKRK